MAKAVLTPKMPYELLTYALKETAFPRQSTGDQFFDHEQFDAYRALGHFTSARPPSRPAVSRAPSPRAAGPAQPVAPPLFSGGRRRPG